MARRAIHRQQAGALVAGLLLACLVAAWPVAAPAEVAPRRQVVLLSAQAALAPRPWTPLFNDVARDTILDVDPVWSLGLYGHGQIVAVADTGLDTGDPSSLSADFQGRLVEAFAWGRPDDWSDTQGHGTHVAGSAVGSGALSGSDPAAHRYGESLAGVAPEAGLIVQSLLDADGGLGGLPDDLGLLLAQAYDAGARIHTNSWGGNLFIKPLARFLTASRYDESAVQVDRFVWEHPDMVVLFAAGNEGVDLLTPTGDGLELPPPDGVVDPQSLGSPGPAKNVITVGASESVRSEGGHAAEPWGGEGDFLSGLLGDTYPAEPLASDLPSNNASGMAAFSSRGPTNDGRIKPDVVAPGTNIVSARSHAPGATDLFGPFDDNYVYCSGTSMSTPLVAGAVALIREWYVERRGVPAPSAALIKATLINGTVDIQPGQFGAGPQQDVPAAWPNPVSGWGRVSVQGSIAPAGGREVWFVDQADGLAGGEASFTRYAGASTEPLRVTLVWTDPPGPAEAEGIQLPGLTQPASPELINDLDLIVETPEGRTLYGNMGEAPDRLNNVEAIRVDNPTAGEYRLAVQAHQVAQGPQPFALVMAGQRVVSGPEEASDVQTSQGSNANQNEQGWVIPLLAGIGLAAGGLVGGSVLAYRAQVRRRSGLPRPLAADMGGARGATEPRGRVPAGAGAAPGGMPPASLRAESGPLAGQVMPVSQTPFTIGRGAENNLVVPDSPVSRRHAQIELRDNTWYVRDLESSNGTFLNRQRLTGAQPLHSGDLIALGDSVFAFTVLAAAAARPVARPLQPMQRGPARAANRRSIRLIVAAVVALVLILLAVAVVLLAGGLKGVETGTESGPGLPEIPLPNVTLPALPTGLPALPTGLPGLSTALPGLPTPAPGATGLTLPTNLPGLPTGLPALPGLPKP